MSSPDSDDSRLMATLTAGTSPVAASVLVEREPGGDLPVISMANYDFGGEIAKGGMGRIFAARDRRLDRPVAIKQLLVHSESLRRRFDREVRLSARLQHPAIVSVLEAGQWPNGDPFYAMKLVVGRSLGVVIDERGGLDERLALLPHVIAASDALAYAHGQGIIHRDLKPGNVLVGDFGETVVIDWGLAKDMRAQEPDVPAGPYRAAADDGHTIAGEVIGTPAYMPPEQARGQAVDQRADVYSLGALLYHLLAGVPPFLGTSSKQILADVLSRAPEPLERRQAGVPPDLLAVVAKAMATDPAARYPSAAELAADLKRFQTGQLVSAHEYSGGELVARWLRRHRAMALLGSAALLTIAVVAGVSFARVRHERGVAEDAAAQASARANALVLTQAESSLRTDPTRTIAWLKTYPESGDDWPRVRALADDARSRGVARRVLRRNQHSSNQAAIRGHGRRVLSFDGVNELRTWDVDSGHSSARCLDVPRMLGGDTASLSGAWILYGSRDGLLSAWQPESDERDLVTAEPELWNATIASDGRWVALAAHDGAVHLVDRRSNRDVPFSCMDGSADDVRFLHEGARLLVSGGVGRLELWDVPAHALLYSSPPGVGRYVVAPDERYLVWMTAGGIVWLDMDTQAMAFLATELDLFEPIAFFPDGRVLAGDKKRGSLVWDARTQETRAYAKLLGGATAVSSDGRRLASGASDGKLRVLDLDSGDLQSFVGHVAGSLDQVSFMPGDGEVLTDGGDGVLRMWPVAGADATIWRLDPSNSKKPELAVRDDGKLMVASEPDGTLWRRALPAGEPTLLGENQHPVKQMAFFHDGEHLLVADAAGELSRWTLADGQRQVLAHDVPALTRLLITRDGRHAVGTSYHRSQAWVWDLSTGQGTLITLSAGGGDFSKILLSPDDRYVGLSSPIDTIHMGGLYDLARGQPVPLDPGPTSLSLFGFSPSARFVFASPDDGTLSRFDLERHTHIDFPLRSGSASAGVALGDGALLFGGQDQLSVWLPALGITTRVGRLIGRADRIFPSPSGGRVLIQNGDAFVVWDLVTGEQHTLRGHDGGFPSESWATDDLVVSATSDGTVRLWPLPSFAPPSPRETLAWLGSLTNLEIGDLDVREPACR